MSVATTTAVAGNRHIDKPMLAITGGFIVLFCVWALIDIDGLAAAVDLGFA